MGITGRLKRDIEKRIGGAKKPSKYKNIRTTVDGVAFASKKEAAHYVKLKAMEKVGIITDLTLQPKFPIVVNGYAIGFYAADFSYTVVSTGIRFVDDVKGMRTAVYKIKKKLVEALYVIRINEI